MNVIIVRKLLVDHWGSCMGSDLEGGPLLFESCNGKRNGKHLKKANIQVGKGKRNGKQLKTTNIQIDR